MKAIALNILKLLTTFLFGALTFVFIFLYFKEKNIMGLILSIMFLIITIVNNIVFQFAVNKALIQRNEQIRIEQREKYEQQKKDSK